jgi:hypothetical protein
MLKCTMNRTQDQNKPITPVLNDDLDERSD